MSSHDHKSEMLVCTLIEAAADKDDAVRMAVNASLRKIAKRHPTSVLENAVAFRKRHPKLPSSHLTSLLHTILQICLDSELDVDGDTLLLLIEFAVDEMTAYKDYFPDLQMPASSILVALGQTHCIEVMEGLLKHFQPGVLPHYSILHTMGALASANVFGTVPFVKATLGAMLPMMGMLRNEAMKQVFSFTLGKFSDAILEYLSNIDKAPDPTVNKEVYETEIHIAYDVLVSSWLNTRDPKVCESVLQAIGPMFSLLSSAKVTEQAPRLISSLLSVYRRGNDAYPVTTCLATVLLVTIEVKPTSLEPLLDSLLANLFEMVCSTPDYAQPLTLKNHYEVLRCFDRIAAVFCDRVVELLMSHLKNNNERERLKSLLVVTHLVNSSDNLIGSRVPDLVATLKPLLTDPSIRVRKTLLKTIVALACRGHATQDQGTQFIEFVVRQCCPNNLPASQELEDLQQTSSSTLYLLATTVPLFQDSLWSQLLGFLLSSQYTPACATLASCLSRLAVKRTNPSGSTANGNAVFARCLALLANPLAANRGVLVLTFLKNYVEDVSRLLKPLWSQRIPELIQYLTDCSGWSERAWEDLVLAWLEATLREVGAEQWSAALGACLIQQAALYVEHQSERGMMLKCLAVVACASTDKQMAARALDVITAHAREHSTLDSKACARAVGLCSRRHLDRVLPRLELMLRDEMSRKSSRLLGFMKDARQEGEVERARMTLILAYGEVAAEAPADQLLPAIENNMAVWVTSQLQQAKELAVREAALRTLGHIAEALGPSKNVLNVVLESRAAVLSLLLAQLELGQLVPTTLQVATHFVRLVPRLTSDQRVGFLRTCLERVFLLIASTEDTAGEVTAEMVGLSSLGRLMQELMLDAVTPATLDDLFTLLEPWMSQTDSRQRLAAVSLLQDTLQCYLDNVQFGFQNPSEFSVSGLILGSVVPRCTDPQWAVRSRAIHCVNLMLCIADRYEGHSPDYDDQLTAELQALGLEIQTDDSTQLFKVTSDLAKIICVKLPHGQLLQFIESLMGGLLDGQAASSSGASVLLNIFIKTKGGEMYHYVHDILSNILRHMGNIQCNQTLTGSLRAVLSLAQHHPKAVVSALLRQPLPYDENVSKCWKMLAQDPVLSVEIVEQFIQIISTTPLYDDQKDRDKLRIAVLLPLSAISALNEMFMVASMEQLVTRRFPELFSMLLIALGCYVGASPPIHTPQDPRAKSSFVPNRNAYKLNPARVALDAFSSLLLCVRCDAGAEALLQCSHMEVGESLTSFIAMVPHLTRAICSKSPHSLARIVVCLNQYGTSSCYPQRITVAAFYAELVCVKTNGEMVLLEGIVNNLLNYLNDQSPVVRRLSLRGLSAVSCLHDDQRIRHTQPVLMALIAGLDDQDASHKDSIPLEAMRGFSQMLQVIDQQHVTDIQVSVALRIKPFFEKENVNVRAAAFEMFGDLAKFGGSSSKAAFQEQVNNNLLCLLLHLADGEKTVVKACKYALRQVSPLLGADRINAMMQDHLIDDANLHYPEFIADIVKIMVEELSDLVPLLIMHALSYVKSSQPNIRGDAAMFVGLLCGSVAMSESVPMETVCSRLIHLLQDQDQGVRAKAAQALSHLFINV